MTVEAKLTLCIVETRKIICFLRPGQKPNHEYAILTRAFDATVDQCCTCLNVNDHLQTYSYKDIDMAIKRLHNKNDYCPLKDNIPTAQLHRLLLDRMLTMMPSLEEVVAAMEIKFVQQVAEAAAKKPLRVRRKKPETEDGHEGSPLTNLHYEMGMMVRRWFERRELPKNHNPEDGLLGVFVNGRITALGKKGMNNMYKISYEAPISDDRWIDGEEASRYRATYTCTYPSKLLIPPLTINVPPEDQRIQNTVPQDAANSVKKDSRSDLDIMLTHKTTQREEQAQILVQERLDELFREHELAANGVAIDATIAENIAGLMVQYKAKALDDYSVGNNAQILVQQMLDELLREHELAANGVAIDATIADNIAGRMPSITHVDVSRPTRKYNKEEKQLRSRLFPCIVCSEPADGSHQCGYCFCHLHVPCAPPYPGTTEGFGQLRMCPACVHEIVPQDTSTPTAVSKAVVILPARPQVSPTPADCIEIEKGYAIPLVPLTKTLGKKAMSDKEKQRREHRKKEQMGGKKRELLPENVQGVTKKRKIRRNGTKKNDAISLPTNVVNTLPNVVPTALMGQKRKKHPLKRSVQKRRENLRKQAEQRKAESAQQVMEEPNKDNDVEQTDWRWDEVYATWIYEPFEEITRRKRKKNLTNKSVKNRILAMRRTWNTPKKDEMIAKISIDRSELNTVR
jgi:hypothetical protein